MTNQLVRGFAAERRSFPSFPSFGFVARATTCRPRVSSCARSSAASRLRRSSCVCWVDRISACNCASLADFAARSARNCPASSSAARVTVRSVSSFDAPSSSLRVRSLCCFASSETASRAARRSRSMSPNSRCSRVLQGFFARGHGGAVLEPMRVQLRLSLRKQLAQTPDLALGAVLQTGRLRQLALHRFRGPAAMRPTRFRPTPSMPAPAP